MSYFECLTVVILTLGLGGALLQVERARHSLKAQVLMRLFEDWRKPDILAAIRYVHDLRKEWKKSETPRPEQWNILAEAWVLEHQKPKWSEEQIDALDTDEGKKEVRELQMSETQIADLDSEKERTRILTMQKKLSDGWIKRRTASQFLAKSGSLIEAGYLTPDDFFGVVPETGRLLAVLNPIEIAIREEFSKEGNRIGEWDHPFPKWEFTKLLERYRTWYKGPGKLKRNLEQIDWSNEQLAVNEDPQPENTAA